MQGRQDLCSRISDSSISRNWNRARRNQASSSARVRADISEQGHPCLLRFNKENFSRSRTALAAGPSAPISSETVSLLA